MKSMYCWITEKERQLAFIFRQLYHKVNATFWLHLSISMGLGRKGSSWNPFFFRFIAICLFFSNTHIFIADALLILHLLILLISLTCYQEAALFVPDFHLAVFLHLSPHLLACWPHTLLQHLVNSLFSSYVCSTFMWTCFIKFCLV